MSQPLADLMRPTTFTDFVGQAHLVGENKPLRSLLEAKKIHSMIFWGPPGVGKTTLAGLIAQQSGREIITFSAVLAGIKEVKDAIKMAQDTLEKAPILFIDEIHRFNKGQQDALLPFVEHGSVILIGATTENPSFEINNALLSRCRIYVLKSLEKNDLAQLVQQALLRQSTEDANVWEIEPAGLERLIMAADGDARSLLNILEIAINRSATINTTCILDKDILEIIQQDFRRFDKRGDIFYEQISALHKSVRGSSPDGALYWLARMLEADCDPLYIARRIIRMASEDIGNADPRALTLALNAYDAYDRLGSPEGELALAQTVVYLAVAPKSNAAYMGFKAALRDIRKKPSYAVPMHLRNATTQMMKKMSYGKGYRYDHDEQAHFSAGQTYFPDELGERHYYHPTQNGLEQKISEKLERLRSEQNRPLKGNSND